MYHKTNYFLKRNNSKEIIEKKISRKPNFIIKPCSPPKSAKQKTEQNINKINAGKKRPLSTRYKLNISNNIYSIEDLLELNQSNKYDSLSNDLTLPNYIIGKTLGKGAYAIVKIATHKITNEKYAAKIYKKSEIRDKIRKRCVNNEIEILKRISHKNIIKLIEVIELKEHIFIIQELFFGISLSQYYNKNWKTEDLSKEKEKTYKIILRQIFEAMDYLHKNDIAHLDLKLENIMINKQLEIRIIDFGFGIYDPKKTLNLFFGGTPNYMSPEIVLKRPYISILSDIWSLGVLVFKLFCNDYPFKGFTERDLFIAIKKGKFRIKCYVNYDVKKIINSMLVLEPNKRLSLDQLLKSPWFTNNNKDK
jgi:serine/threonine protein kinase